jgi:hypothetical protein
MVEAIFVISVFILFFLGMVYFYSLYHEHLRVQQLARAGAVAYAMDACQDSNPLQAIEQDLGASNGQRNTTNNPATAGAVGQPNPPIGDKGGADPVAGSMQSSGFVGVQIAGITMNGKAAGTTTYGLLSPRVGFRSDVISTSYIVCGDPQKDGDAAGAWDYVKDLFSMSF